MAMTVWGNDRIRVVDYNSNENNLKWIENDSRCMQLSQNAC